MAVLQRIFHLDHNWRPLSPNLGYLSCRTIPRHKPLTFESPLQCTFKLSKMPAGIGGAAIM